MPHIDVPVIGIGAGLATDGQVLVFHDLLGITPAARPRFVKRYADIHDRMVEGVRGYAQEVRARRFPDAEHVYPADPAAVEELREYLDREASPPRPGTGTAKALLTAVTPVAGRGFARDDSHEADPFRRYR